VGNLQTYEKEHEKVYYSEGAVGGGWGVGHERSTKQSSLYKERDRAGEE
jgi:hypothetical protein